MKHLFVIIISFIVLSTACFAQVSPSTTSPTANSAYSYSGTMGDEEQLRIYTQIWGQVRKPGFYLVPDDTDLLTLLSLAGGPTEDAKLSKIRIVRPSEETGRGEVIWVNVKKYLDTGNFGIIPVLKPGDTVVVSGTVFYGMERVADFLAKFATVLSIYNLYLTIQNK